MICCCSLAGTKACENCVNNTWKNTENSTIAIPNYTSTNHTVTPDEIEINGVKYRRVKE